MKTINYHCSHCGHKFQDEDKDILECPSCFWSSTVKREGEADAREQLFGPGGDLPKKQKGPLTFFLASLLKLVIILTIIALVGAGAFWAWNHYSGQNPSRSSQKGIGKIFSKKDRNVSIPVEAIKAMEDLATFETISPEAQNILNRRVQISKDRKPSAAEKAILEAKASFRTGLIENLPSQLWTLESFNKLIADQEEAYRIPLARSYKKKLKRLFEQKYIPSVQAFEAGDLLGARNLWVESLIFPVYRDDLQRHRSVALTMLRPFINDTLSKIGVVNNIFIERTIRDREQVLSKKYQELLSLLASGSWDNSFEAIMEVERLISELEKPNRIVSEPTPYPQTAGAVDRDIRATLFDLLSAPLPGITDLAPLKEDVLKKKTVVQGFREAALIKQQEIYDRAIDQISNRDWQGALQTLGRIKFPLALFEDAREKIKMIQESGLT